MIRVGGQYYANALPFFYPLFANRISHEVEFTWGPPKKINTMVLQGDVDVGMVSSLTFTDHRSDFVLLSDVGIAARGAVESVCLFVPEDNDSHDFSEIFLTNESETSIRLLQVLCNNFWNIFPEFLVSTVSDAELIESKKIFLTIGDRCLSLLKTPKYLRIDLAKAWHMATGKGFIFGMLVTNNRSLQKKSEPIFEFHRDIDRAFQWSQENFSEIIDYAHSRIPAASKEFLYSYYTKALEYRLSPIHFQGLECFSQLENRVHVKQSTPIPVNELIKLFVKMNTEVHEPTTRKSL
ncbi:MAG: menaquinone biosynthesis protein [Chlamydia sp.]